MEAFAPSFLVSLVSGSSSWHPAALSSNLGSHVLSVLKSLLSVCSHYYKLRSYIPRRKLSLYKIYSPALPLLSLAKCSCAQVPCLHVLSMQGLPGPCTGSPSCGIHPPGWLPGSAFILSLQWLYPTSLLYYSRSKTKLWYLLSYRETQPPWPNILVHLPSYLYPDSKVLALLCVHLLSSCSLRSPPNWASPSVSPCPWLWWFWGVGMLLA